MLKSGAFLVLVDALGAPQAACGVPTPEGLAQTVAALIPENAIISDERIAYGRGFYGFTHAAPAHDWLHLTGGAIGDGMPVATGAALAAGKQRRVINLQADGSAMESLQSLWTQAREPLPITTVILNNSTYNTLLGEGASVGATPGPTAMGMLDLGRPQLEWLYLANGMGVEAARASTMEQCTDLLKSGFGKTTPLLIELMV